MLTRDLVSEQRQREKERKKRGARKYGQANFKHSRMGIVSCISGIGGLLILADALYMRSWREETPTGLSEDLQFWRLSWLATGSGLRYADFMSVSVTI